MKLIKVLFILSILMIQASFGVSIVLDGTKSIINGSDCSTATYRFGTTTSYNGDNLDVILEVTDEDNDFLGGACVDTQSGVVSFHIRDNDDNDNVAFMDLKFTIVKHNTLTPVNVDTITITNFDLDRSSTLINTLTDDIYYKDPLQTLISNDSDVLNISGDFYNKYTVKLRGKNDGNCNDSATLTELSCRAGAIWKNTSTVYARVQNDNAYGSYNWFSGHHRLIQFSFEYDDIAPLISENNTTKDCGTYSFSTNSDSWIEGATHSSYNNNLNIQKNIFIPNASQLKISFNGETEEDYDYLYIIDENGVEHEYSGDLNNQNDLIINGSSVTLKFISDGNVVREGVTITIESLGCNEETQPNTATCYALTDNSNRLYKVTMNPNATSLPTASYVNINHTFNGEGSAYRASNNKFYAFTGVSDDVGPSDLYSIDVDSGVVTPVQNNIISGTQGTVEGAEFYFDPTLNKEILYVISQEEDSKLYAFDPDNNWALLAGYPKDTHTDLSSLAINPINGEAYAIDDYNYHGNEPKVYKLNLKTGTTIHITTLQNLADAEGLAFASDGNLYIEDEGSYDDNLNGQKLYKINLQTGELIPSAITNSNGDIEGLSCNGTQMAIDNPTLSLDGNRSVLEGDVNTTDFIFPITLSKPATDDIVLNYEITDINTTANEDYILDSNLSVLIPKDANSSSIVIKVKGDRDVEGDESFSLRLLDATNAIVNSSSVVGTIIDDDEETPLELVAEYRFDKCNFNGLTVEDSSGNDFHGTVTGDVETSSEAKVVRSGHFKGGAVDANLSGLNSTTNGAKTTVSFWMNWNGSEASGGGQNWGQIPISWGEGSDSYNLHIDVLRPNEDTTLQIGFNTHNADNYGVDVEQYAHGWHHIVAIFNNGNVEGSKLYIDGVEQLLHSTPGRTPINSRAHVRDKLRIGGVKNSNQPYAFKDYLDEIKIYKGELNSTQITQIYNNENIGKNWDGTTRESVVCEEDMQPFICNETLYLSNRTELGTGSGDSGATWLHSFYAIGATYAPIGDGFTSGDGGYNAIGYNVQDNFIYALYGNHLLKIDADAIVKDLGAVQGLPSEQLYAGEFDRDGFYYVTGTGIADNKMYKIDIEQKKVVATITLSQSVRFWDMAIDTSGDYFYTMLIQNNDDNSSFENNKFAKIKISDGTITTIGSSHSDLPSYTSLIFTDAEGKIIALSQDGKLYEIMPQSGKVYFTRPFAPLSFYNDGTSCPDANITLPPHPPRLSINNVSELEGDSGETTFNFTVTADKPFDMSPMSGAIFYYRVVDGDGDEVVPPHEVALSSDHDFKAQEGIGMGMSLFSNGVSINIPVTVYGDEKVERDEEFYVEIYSPQLPPMMNPKYVIDKNIGIGTIINDDYDFNIERVDSNNSGNNQIQKESLYTQITNKDFDYAIVSYNGQDEYNINNTLFKIELLDMNTTDENNVLYTGYYYANEELKSRFPIEDSDDLKIQRATREARFKIYYILDINSTKVNEFNTLQEAYENFESNSSFKKDNSYSRDSFAIRPTHYRIELNDLDENNQTVTYATNYNTQTQELKLVAGYPYALKAYAIKDSNNTIATHYKTVNSKELNVTLDFDETGTTYCADTNTTKIENYNFSNGQLNQEISHNNVGKYTLHIEDINWTDIDKDGNNLGCVVGSSSNEADETNGMFGCNIASNEGANLTDISMSFQPYKFEFSNTTLSNINGNGKDYVYMSDLNRSTEMGVKLSSTIKALGKQDSVLSNFTNGCIEGNPNLTVKLKFEFEDDRGTWSDSNMTYPKSADREENLMPQQIVAFNDNNISESNMTIIKDINIKKKDFEDDKNGTMSVEILYNMEKLFNKPTNPIRVDFISLDLNSTDLEGKLEAKDNTPVGLGDINDSRIFYFARVSSYLKYYPETNKKSINTPLFVEVYCRKKMKNQNWCRDTMKLTANGMLGNGQKTYKGWYLATQHDSATEGRVLELKNISTHDTDKITTNYTTSIPLFKHGKIENIQTLYVDGDLKKKVKAKIEIVTDLWLRFNKKNKYNNALYFVTMAPIAGMTGVSPNKDTELGYNLMRDKKGTLNGMVEKNGKMSW